MNLGGWLEGVKTGFSYGGGPFCRLCVVALRRNCPTLLQLCLFIVPGCCNVVAVHRNECCLVFLVWWDGGAGDRNA